MRGNNWIVQPDDDGIRPHYSENCCFYCQSWVGEEHLEECVIRIRTVVIGWENVVGRICEFVILMPESFDPETIEFILNGHCDDPLLTYMGSYTVRQTYDLKPHKKTQIRYLREASVLDEERHKVRVPISSSAKLVEAAYQ